MEQICNLVYFTLTDDRSTAQIAELDAMLSDPRDRQKMIDRQNAIAMQQLMSSPVGMVGPPAGGPTPVRPSK